MLHVLHVFITCVNVCLQRKLRFDLLGDVSLQSGQYHLLPQSQMEAGWGAGAQQTKAAQSPNIIIGLREAIKPSLPRLPLLQPAYRPIAFWFVRVIFLSGLYDNMIDDLVLRLLLNSSRFSSPGEPSDTFICHRLLRVCAATLGQKRGVFTRVTTGFNFRL